MRLAPNEFQVLQRFVARENSTVPPDRFERLWALLPDSEWIWVWNFGGISMKRAAIFVTILALAVGAGRFGYAWGDQDKGKGGGHKDDHGNQGHQQHDQDHGKPQSGHYQHPESKHQDHYDHQREQYKDMGYKGNNGNHYGQQKQMERAWQDRRATHWESEHRGWNQRGGYHGYRVPPDYFRVHYGHDHLFRVYSVPFAYEGGNPRFQFGGRWFTVMDPYPEYWGPTWYQTDDVYVDYHNDGYYLFNRRYPGRPGIAININF